MTNHMNNHTPIQKNMICIIFSTLLFLGCITVSGQSAYAASSGTDVTVKIGDAKFKAKFNNSKASKKLLNKMTFTIKMSELNGNEKYKYLDYELPTNEKKVKTIHAGDIMLYGSDCLVIFYEDFDTTYAYTRIGKITDTSGLKAAAGDDIVKVRFSKTKKTPSLNKKRLKLKVGQTYTLKLKNAKASKVKWSVSDKTVASVKAGKVKAKKQGRSVITAKYGNKKYKCVLSVTADK